MLNHFRIEAIENNLKETQQNNAQMKRDVKDLQQVCFCFSIRRRRKKSFPLIEKFKKLEDVDIELQNSQGRCADLAQDNAKLVEQLRLQHEELENERLNNVQVRQTKNFSTEAQENPEHFVALAF